jgi:hypothetical protein
MGERYPPRENDVADRLEQLRAGLREMPVPEPRAGFEDRVLAHATGPRSRARAVRSALRRPSTWWAAMGGALAATLAWVAVLWMQPGATPEPRLVLSLHEVREVPLVIDSERDLEGATIRLYVTGSVGLAGYEQQHEVEWMASLTQGANLLSLPVVFAQTPPADNDDDLDVTMRVIVDPDAKMPDEIMRRIPLPKPGQPAAGSAPQSDKPKDSDKPKEDKPKDSGKPKDADKPKDPAKPKDAPKPAPPGQQRATDPRDQGREFGEQVSEQAKQRSEEARRNKDPKPPKGPPPGRPDKPPRD